jgi:hypothetical protein
LIILFPNVKSWNLVTYILAILKYKFLKVRMPQAPCLVLVIDSDMQDGVDILRKVPSVTRSTYCQHQSWSNVQLIFNTSLDSILKLIIET